VSPARTGTDRSLISRLHVLMSFRSRLWYLGLRSHAGFWESRDAYKAHLAAGIMHSFWDVGLWWVSHYHAELWKSSILQFVKILCLFLC
jgi:hypothetical protein